MKKDRSDLYDYSNGEQFKGKSTTEIFTTIADQNYWVEEESVSGFGSSKAQTAEIIRLLPEVFQQFSIHTLLDAPCGDFNWMKGVDLTGIDYTGADIVAKIVNNNNLRYSKENIKFTRLDLLKDDLGAYDLLFCRDCLVHLSFADIQTALNNIKESSITYLMTTTFPEQDKNKDIQTGGWRPLDLEKAPFNFPPPIYLLNEKCSEQNGIFQDKSLGLWEVRNL